MAEVPWTKFQDFYLRLGFLKALVGMLGTQRRSATNDSIYRRLHVPLFKPAHEFSQLWKLVSHRMTWYEKYHEQGDYNRPTVAEALLVTGDCPSLLFAVTEPTVYKILDWAHDVGFVGRGNQITERGLLLRFLLPQKELERFFAGDVLAWNPFVLTVRERLFFSYHLCEIDHVTRELIGDLAAPPVSDALESLDAGRLTCRALHRVLADAKDRLQPNDVPKYRIALDLAREIAQELGEHDPFAETEGTIKRRFPKPIKLGARRSALLKGVSGREPRRNTKDSEHQTIPRFEQLVDLGFLKKPDTTTLGHENPLESRRRWRYSATPACQRWIAVRRRLRSSGAPFEWHGFATAVTHAFGLDGPGEREPVTYQVLARYLWRAYEVVRRPIGHTPFDSVAVFAMVLASSEGYPAELAQLHFMMLAVKQSSLLPEHAFFASGNDLEKMFILLKPGFLEQIESVIPTLPALPG